MGREEAEAESIEGFPSLQSCFCQQRLVHICKSAVQVARVHLLTRQKVLKLERNDQIT